MKEMLEKTKETLRKNGLAQALEAIEKASQSNAGSSYSIRPAFDGKVESRTQVLVGRKR